VGKGRKEESGTRLSLSSYHEQLKLRADEGSVKASQQEPVSDRGLLIHQLPRETVWKSKWGRLMTYAPEHEKELLN
jgi:hypothetical protein